MRHTTLISTALAAGALLAATPASAAPSPDVVISEIYGGGGNSGATLQSDYVELYNRSAADVDLSTWSIQYGSAANNLSQRANLTGSIPAGEHYLVELAAGGGGTVPLPEPDDTGGTNLSATTGKVALVTNQTTQGCGAAATPCTGNTAIRDFVGFGTSATAEGANAPAPSTTTSISRAASGLDTDNNAADFTAGAPDPRNTKGEGLDDSEPEPGEPSRIHDVQGGEHLSPLEGERVEVPGVVTAVARPGATPQGYWIQDPDADADPNTSEGIFVFEGSGVSVGDSVRVTGTVKEYRRTTASLSLTELTDSFAVPNGPDATIAPALVGPVPLDPPTQVIEDDTGNVETGEFEPDEDGIDWHETHEGMLVRIASPRAVGPTNDFGETATVPEGIGGPFTPRGGIYVTLEDFNPERFIFDDVVAEVPRVDTGDAFAGSVDAVVDYAFDNFKYYPTDSPKPIDNNLEREVTEAPRANQLAMASMNVENLDPLDPPTKFAELAEIVVDNLRSPDILAVEEVQDNDGPTNSTVTDASLTYEAFAAAIRAAGGPSYAFREIDPVDDQDGGEPGGNIRVGFMYRTDRGLEFVDRGGAGPTDANSVDATRKGAALRYSPGRIDPTNPAFNSSRKPLAAEFLWRGRTVFAIANHFSSKSGDQPLFGRYQPPAQSSAGRRHEQAAIVGGFVEEILAADPRAAVAVLGDLNDFQFSETLGILEGSGLVNLMETLPLNEQYSYVFDGNSQVLDQILVTRELLTPEPEYDSVHVNAEFTRQASDHDPQIARVVVRGTGNAE